ncbi:MAG TPA: dihydrolipoamide acetyltransferase family protein [Polyangia bacterium]|jgi:pyruvate dehydrogenase E2 component (dihydrolipoamide acetyltransferase)
MTYEFKLPDIGEGVVEGEVVRWLVKEGDRVREDQPLVEVMTDKATVEIPAPRAGVVGKRLFSEGQICPVGKVLLTIETDVASTAAPAPAASVVAKAAAPLVPASSPTASDPGRGTMVLATPATRKLARELRVDIRLVVGTGRAGRITSDDVRGHGPSAGGIPLAASGSVGDAGDVRIPFRGVRKKIAERLVHSKHTAAHFTYVEEIDCTELVQLRAKANERLAARGVKLSYLPFIIKATVGALAKYPQLNATLDEKAGEIVQRRAHHIGLATATDNGLIVPVIRDCTTKSLLQLAQEIDRLAEVTRSNKATREELSGSTFTITSLGTLGGLLATPIINFPEVAILGVHKIAKRAVVIGDKIVARDMMNLSISVDHRVVDGYDAARLVADIKASLESPGLLMVDLL